MFFFLVEIELEPCKLFNAPYILKIYHVMTFNSTCEMKSITYHNIVMSKLCK